MAYHNYNIDIKLFFNNFIKLVQSGLRQMLLYISKVYIMLLYSNVDLNFFESVFFCYTN